MSKRKLFKFYRSYYDVMNELPEKEQLKFIKAILDRQFIGVEPDLKGISKFAYISQKHSIDRQVSGYEDKTGDILTPMQGGVKGGVVDPYTHPSIQVQEEEKEEEKEKEEVQYRSFDHLSITYKDHEKLISIGYSENQVDSIYDSIENYKNNKNYKSLYLTAKKWLEKEGKKTVGVKYSNPII